MRARSIAIVGAGVAGLACGRKLAAACCRVVVFEKSRSFGGRCASRFWNGHVIDHGAQYFTVTDPRVRADLQGVVPPAMLRPLDAPIIDVATGQPIPSAKGERFYYQPGNNRIGQALAGGLEIRMRTVVEAIERGSGGRWMVAGEVFDSVVVTCPYPQAARLVGRDAAEIDYAPCLTALFEYEGVFAGDSALRYAWMDHTGAGDLAWTACENHKVGRVAGDHTVFVVQASERFSRRYLEAAPEDYVPLLRPQLEALWSIADAAAPEVFTHRWRFARLADNGPVADAARAEVAPGVFLAGDAFGGSRVEGAWKNGLDMALRILGS